MKYESAKTEKGNVGVSLESQEEADAQAKMMDDNNCTYCYNCTDCYNCYKCYNCTDCFGCNCCYNCYKCNNCYKCYNCTDCSGILIWRGAKAANLKAINGLRWPIATDGINIQIGCQHHSIERWEKFSDEAIAEMDNEALGFWNTYKNLILLFAKEMSK